MGYVRAGRSSVFHIPLPSTIGDAPPPRCNEGTLIEAMQNAQRFVEGDVLRERLKEAKRTGTPGPEPRSLEG